MYTNSLFEQLKNQKLPLFGQQGTSDEMAKVLGRLLGRALVGYPLNNWHLGRKSAAETIADIKKHHDAGQIVEVDWHIHHPLAKSYNSGDLPLEECSVVKYRDYLEESIKKVITEIFLPLKELGINICSRFFHECSGAWFWWGNGEAARGKTMNTPEDVRNVHIMAFNLLETMGATNVLYVFNVNTHGQKSESLGSPCYPGKDFCHIISFDCYVSNPEKAGDMTWLKRIAKRDGKLFAIAEFGLNTKINQVWAFGEKRTPEDVPLYWSRWAKFASQYPACYQRIWWGFNKPCLPVQGVSELQDQAYKDMIENYLPTVSFAGGYTVNPGGGSIRRRLIRQRIALSN